MGKALEGVRILDMTHVQSGPTGTQILAWLGADVIKVERPGKGDATRGQLRDLPDVDSLYFTMLNHNKRSVTLNPKTEAGKKIFTRLIEECDVLAENFAPGAVDRMGFPWETIQEINRVSSMPRSRDSALALTKTAKSTRTSRSAPAGRHRRRARSMAFRW